MSKASAAVSRQLSAVLTKKETKGSDPPASPR